MIASTSAGAGDMLAARPMELLTELARWTRVAFAGGAQLRNPAGAVTIRAQVHPIPRLRALVGEPAQVERFATLEGEHAVLARAARRTVAMVVGDHAAAVLDGAGADPDAIQAFVRELARHSFLGLGAVRRRRYLFAPPPGWTAIAQPYAARYLHPRYPRTPHAITVAHARPRAMTAPEVIDREVLTDRTRGMLKDPPRPLAHVASRRGLAGVVATITGRPGDAGPSFAVVRAALADERFEYVVELEAPAASVSEGVPVLAAIVDSIEPVPAPQLADVSSRILYWGDEPRG